MLNNRLMKQFIALVALSFTLLILIFAGKGIINAQNANCPLKSKTQTNIIFVNRSNRPVTLYSLNQQCKEVLRSKMQPGVKYTQKAYLTELWHVRDTEKGWLLKEFTPTTATPTAVRILNLATNLNRTIENRPDEVSGYQIQVMYVIPKDGKDEALDTNDKIANSVAAWQQWFVGQTKSQRFRLDTFNGALDIPFVRLSQTDSQIKSTGAKVRDLIEAELKTLGFNDPQKLYAVYYGGSSSVACGGHAFPPKKIGHVAAVFLHGTSRENRPCESNELKLEMIHQIIHGLGYAQPCATHYTEQRLPGHVSDSPKDLLYDGNEMWQPSILDIGHDDYFKHNKPGCLDLAKSVFLDPTAANPVLPPGWSNSES
jgi:hypothetical protein